MKKRDAHIPIKYADTLKGKADIDKQIENYTKAPYWTKKNVCYRTNSLNEVKRIYLYLNGNMQGYSMFDLELKKGQPEAEVARGKNVEWNFSEDYLWEKLNQHEKFAKTLKAMRLNSMEELTYKTML